MISSRLTARLALGILCGVLLVFIPAVLSVNTATPANTNTSTSTYGLATLIPVKSQANPDRSGLNSSGSNGLSLLAILLFIFLPSTIFSLVIRRWAEKRARDYLWRES